MSMENIVPGKSTTPAEPVDLTKELARERAGKTTPTTAGTSSVTQVELTRSSANSDRNQQALWTAIRTSTNATNFNLYSDYLDTVFCSSSAPGAEPGASLWASLENRAKYTFMGVDAYTLLKKATEAFLIVHCGVVIRNEKGTAASIPSGSNGARGGNESITMTDPVTDVDGADESNRIGTAWTYEAASQALSNYLNRGGTLPYLDRIVTALFPKANPSNPPATEDKPFCGDILRYRWSSPSLVELIWSFWHEEASLVQTMNAIALRFQNRRSPAFRDPLAHLKLDALRPLNNILWGYIQDETNRLTLARRSYEYLQQYGLSLVGKAVPHMQAVENRSKFLEAFNNLLTLASRFFKEDDDKTIKPDAFPILNALKDVHVQLAQGAINQFGDLPWTARVEMLIQKWLLARPEMREYLGRNSMVAYSEPWMSQVETMKSLQGWSDVSITHFRDLGVFGEQLLLSVRYADWSNINDTNKAADWARYWRSELQAYMYSYRAVTGVDLSSEVGDSRSAAARYLQPAVLHRRRAEQQSVSRNGNGKSSELTAFA